MAILETTTHIACPVCDEHLTVWVTWTGVRSANNQLRVEVSDSDARDHIAACLDIGRTEEEEANASV